MGETFTRIIMKDAFGDDQVFLIADAEVYDDARGPRGKKRILLKLHHNKSPRHVTDLRYSDQFKQARVMSHEGGSFNETELPLVRLM